MLAAVSCTSISTSTFEGIRASESELLYSQNEAAAYIVNISSSEAWTSIAPSWVSIEPANGDAGSCRVTIKAEDNEAAQRNGSIIFKSQSASVILKVSQLGVFEGPELLSVYEFLALNDNDTERYSLKGIVRQIQSDESFMLVDNTAKIAVNGLFNEAGSKVLNDYCIAEGDTLTISGVREWKGSDVSVKDALYIAHSRMLKSTAATSRIGEIKNLADFTPVRIKEATIKALNGQGVIASDETGNIYAQGNIGTELAVGDIVNISAIKHSAFLPMLNEAEFEKIGSTVVSYPEVNAYTEENFDAYANGGYDFIAVNGWFWSGEDGTYSLDPGDMANTKVKVLAPVSARTNIGYFVRVDGYVTDITKSDVTMAAVSINPAVEGDGEGVVVAEWPMGTSSTNSANKSGWTSKSPASGTLKDGENTLVFDHSGSVAAGTMNKLDLDCPTSTSAQAKYCPRAYGVFAGDSFTLTANNLLVKPGDKAEVYFEIVQSLNGMKYWYLEYLDGETWQPALETTAFDLDGKGYTYTHMVEIDKVNFPVSAKVKISKPMTSIVFRFTAVSSISVGNVIRYPVGTSGVTDDQLGASGWIQLCRLSEAHNPKIIHYSK